MEALISRRASRLPDTLIWGGTVVALLSLLGMGFQTVYFLLATFPEGGSIGLPGGWLTGIVAGAFLGLVGIAITSRTPGSGERAAEHPSDTARAA